MELSRLLCETTLSKYSGQRAAVIAAQQEEPNSVDEVVECFLLSLTLRYDIEDRTLRNEPRPIRTNHGGQADSKLDGWTHELSSAA